MKRGISLLILAFFTAFSSFTLYENMPNFMGSFENIIKDYMFLYRGEDKKDNRIIIIDIDEKSLKSLGQWPWSRDILARILDNLKEANVSAIGLDMMFPEEDRSSPDKVIKKLNIKTDKKLDDYDEIFAKSIEKSNSILGFYFALEDDGVKPNLEPITNAIIKENNKPKNPYIPKAHRAILSIEKINDSAYSNGFVNYMQRFDKDVRSVPSVISYDGILYPSLSLEVARYVLKGQKIEINYNENGVLNVAIGDTKIPTDIYGNIMINYRGKYPAYKYISAYKIFQKDFKKEQISGKIALFGTSAPSLSDIRSSPYDTNMPGVEAHGNLIDNILNKNFISKPQWSISVDILSVGFLALFAFLTLLAPRIFVSIIAAIFCMGLILTGHYILMFKYGVVLNSSILLLEVVFIYFVGNIINYIYEREQKEFIKEKFANKVSKEVMEEIVNDSTLELKGEEKEISIFFSDIRGFTTISENLKSPHKLIELLNLYMTPMTDIIIKNRGTVDKFIGDAIMAYWNAPNEIENHADFALKSAIEQIEVLKKINRNFKAKNLPLLDIGIGLNAGLCIVGEMGAKHRSDYTCIGDSVNLASRLEGLNKKYKTNIIFSEYFLKKLQDTKIYDFKFLGEEVVKGKSESIKIYACYGYSSNVS